MNPSRGYTLVELIVAIGLFAIVMTLASGGYLIIISAGRHVQATATGIDNLSFALEDMTRSMRTGTSYATTGSTFSFVDQNGDCVTYALASGALQEQRQELCTGGVVTNPLTDPSVAVSALTFRLQGQTRGDTVAPYATIVVTGTVSAGPGKTESFDVETSAAMRGTDI